MALLPTFLRNGMRLQPEDYSWIVPGAGVCILLAERQDGKGTGFLYTPEVSTPDGQTITGVQHKSRAAAIREAIRILNAYQLTRGLHVN